MSDDRAVTNQSVPIDSNRAAAYQLAYEEGVRALSEQQAVIDNLRTRAGLLISGAAIATSFLGGAALDRGPTAWTWIAVVFFLLVGAGVLRVLWPQTDWEYAVRPQLLISSYVEHQDPVPLALIHRDVALHMDASYLQNRGQLLRLFRDFRWASVLLTLEVLAWTVELITQS